MTRILYLLKIYISTHLLHGWPRVADQLVVADCLDWEAGRLGLVPDGDHVGAVEGRQAVARHVLAVEAAVDVLDLGVPLVRKMPARQNRDCRLYM